MTSSLIAPIVSLVAGAGLAAISVLGVISSQTAAPDQSPANAAAPVFDYGTTAP